VWSNASGALSIGLTLTWSASSWPSTHYDIFQVSPTRPSRWLGRTFAPRFSVAPGVAAPFEGESVVRFAVRPSAYPRAPEGEPSYIALRWEAPQ
jgi:hypothetical protein